MTRLKTSARALLFAVGIGLAGGFLLLPVTTYVGNVAREAPMLYAPVAGAWFLPTLFAMLLVRRPGAALISSLVVGVVMSAPSGFETRAAMGMLALGVVMEVTVAVRRYRSWSIRLLAGGVFVACVLHELSLARALDGVLGIPGLLVLFILILISATASLLLARLLARFAAEVFPILGAEQRELAEDRRNRAIAEGWMYDGGSGRKLDTTP